MILSKRADAERFLTSPPPDIRAALIYGRDRSGVRERADALAARTTARPDDPFDVALLTETDLDNDPARLADELTAISMMGGRRLVRLRLTGERAGPDKAAAEALTAHVEGRFNPEAFLLVEAGALDRASPLRKAAEGAKSGAVAIPVYEDEAGDLVRMVREALTADRLSLSNDALQLFVSRLPKERAVARQEIERLALYLGPGSGASADEGALRDFLGVEPESSLADAALDAFGGRTADAYAQLRRARAEGESGPAAVRMLGLHLQKLRRAAVLTGSGAGAQEAAKACGVFWKQEREFLRQMTRWTLSALDVVQPEVLEADRACKSSGAPDHLIAERLALAIAARARRLGL